MPREKITDGCLFALGTQIYYWEPVMESPRVVCERPDVVTSIEFFQVPRKEWKIGMGWPGARPATRDACVDGKVRVDLKDKEVIAFENPVVTVLEVGIILGSLESYKERLQNGDRPGFVYLTWDAIPGCFLIRDNQGAKIKELKLGSIYSPQGLKTDYEFYWSHGGVVYRGLDKSRIEFKTIADSIQLVAWGDSFLICHYHNDFTCPEGVLLSTRDRRTVLSLDPVWYGYPQVVGMMEIANRPYLFYAGLIYPEDEANPQMKISLVPLRVNPDFERQTRVLATLDMGDIKTRHLRQPWRGTNPFCSQQLEWLKEVVPV